MTPAPAPLCIMRDRCNDPTTKTELYFSLILRCASLVKGFGSGPLPPLLRGQLRDVLATILTTAGSAQRMPGPLHDEIKAAFKAMSEQHEVAYDTVTESASPASLVSQKAIASNT